MDSKPAARRSGTRPENLPEGVEVRANGSIRISFVWNGKRHRETIKGIQASPANIKYATRKRGEIINQIARGEFDYHAHFPNGKAVDHKAPDVRHRFTDLIDRFIAHGRTTGSLSPSTLGSYVRWNECRLKPEFATKYIDELNTMELENWIVGLSKELAPKSIRTLVGIVNKVLNKACAAHPPLIEKNPLDPIMLTELLPKPKLIAEEDEDIDPFNRDEIGEILSACMRVHTKALFQFAFATGLRSGELIALKWGNIDWRTGMVKVKDNIVTGEHKVTVEKTTKTDSTRDVPLLPAAIEALNWMKPITLMLNNGGYVFSPDGINRWRNERQIRSHWTTTLRRSKIRYRNPYQTRHTFASTLLMNGEPELLVARLLGHTTVEMVRRHYGKYIRQKNGIQLLGDYNDFRGAQMGRNIEGNGSKNGASDAA